MKVLLTGGGTGGHRTPLVALYHELLKQDDIELHIVAEQGSQVEADFPQADIYYVAAGKFRRYHQRSWRRRLSDWETVRDNLVDGWHVLRGFIQSLRLMRRVKPDVVFGKGGYVSLPVCAAAWLLGIAYVTHDSDTVPGLTNRILARGAQLNLTGFPINFYQYPPEKTRHVGVPVRPAFFEAVSTAAQPNTVLIMGGSLGAEHINQSVVDQLPQLSQLAHILWITGENNYSKYDQFANERVQIEPFIKQSFAEVMAQASVVVSRAGATALSECAVLSKPLIVVPNPLLTGGHQTKNAEVIAEHQAGIVITEADLLSDSTVLTKTLRSLLSSTDERQRLGHNLQQTLPINATEAIVDILIQTTQKPPSHD